MFSLSSFFLDYFVLRSEPVIHDLMDGFEVIIRVKTAVDDHIVIQSPQLRIQITNIVAILVGSHEHLFIHHGYIISNLSPKVKQNFFMTLISCAYRGGRLRDLTSTGVSHYPPTRKTLGFFKKHSGCHFPTINKKHDLTFLNPYAIISKDGGTTCRK